MDYFLAPRGKGNGPRVHTLLSEVSAVTHVSVKEISLTEDWAYTCCKLWLKTFGRQLIMNSTYSLAMNAVAQSHEQNSGIGGVRGKHQPENIAPSAGTA